MALPKDHPKRIELNDEVHARPTEALVAPVRLSYLALLSDGTMREREWQQICDIVAHFAVAAPEPNAIHYSVDLGSFRLKWERHTEFTRYTFIAAGADEDPFAEPPISLVPADWVSELTGKVMVAAHAALLPGSDNTSDYESTGKRLFAGNPLVGSAVAGGAATALTDFRIHQDGFSRLLLQDYSMTPRQAGRIVQRLLEIDTYRIMALLALPVARDLSPFLADSERELTRITTALATATEEDEPMMLDRLTQLAAEIARRESDSRHRFSAAEAYYELVQRRIVDLREERIEGLQTFNEFTERRLAPAMSTCEAVSRRQQSLSQQVGQATRLLSTRVEVTRERQNQAVLASMDRRAKLQLRLQQTVEGLSIAAITYYIVGLVNHAAKALVAIGIENNVDLVTGISIPVVALTVALGVRQVRKMLTRAES